MSLDEYSDRWEEEKEEEEEEETDQSFKLHEGTVAVVSWCLWC